MDDDDQGSQLEHIEIKDIELREYQKELADPAKNHLNVLIVAPTGTGKTHVALAITKVCSTKTKGLSSYNVYISFNNMYKGCVAHKPKR